MATRHIRSLLTGAVVAASLSLWAGHARAANDDNDAPAGADVLMKALVDELGRSMTLQLEDLQPPYFVQFSAADQYTHQITATCGAIVNSDDNHSRRMTATVRVGYYDLDNTNFAGGGFGGRRGRGGGGFGSMSSLPTEDSYLAIRQAAWRATDSAYKSAVETLAQKQAYMQDRTVDDRPEDFARAEPTVSIDPAVGLALDVDAWETRLRELSARLLDYEALLDSRISLTANAENRYLVNSEGSRVRTGDTGVVLTIVAESQAGDGEELTDRITHHAQTADGLPDQASLLAEIDKMAMRLTGRAQSEPLETYLGPVLFDGDAAPQLFQSLLARGVAGTADPVGGGRRRFSGMESLDQYLGKRILPRSFRIFDDPTIDRIGDTYLAGHYLIDDEGVPAQRVGIVVDGRLKGMVMSRTPTRDFNESNGHGRSAGMGNASAAIGCLFVEARDAISDSELTEALLEAARDQELDYALRIASISGAGGGGPGRQPMGRGPGQFPRGGFGGGGGGASALGDPVVVYKVYLDGREELVRGCEFGSIDVGTLKDIIATGSTPLVHNSGSSSVIAPAVVFEECELFMIEEERQTLPIIQAPHQRGE